MTVKIVSITKPEEWTGCSNIEELIAYCARVSNKENQNNHETGAKLVNHLINHKHWSPFEMAHLVMEVETTRDIGRQILRHHSLRFQEFSQRYAEVDVETFVISECRLQDHNNRQNSIEMDIDNLDHHQIGNWWSDTQKEIINLISTRYNEALRRGIAKEVARKILPEGLTPTTLYISANLRDWMFFLKLRSDVDSGTQKEHMRLAQECFQHLCNIAPSIREIA